ncbi:hypothetical protein [Amycolatopsis nigrescens]|uniref:hypothetical protein n=1 Tax=Amycolatopsis nigrescens TaxID=381445 RepID=UPI00035FB767|nr:hypothetical protein [Amycolatopsis nigrescens]
MGSKADFFDDEGVQRLLLKHHIRVHVTRTGSRDVATNDVDAYDFVFPSGQPTALLIFNERNRTGKYVTVHRPFVSPIVLATYREYAETLREAGAASVQSDGGDASYYNLDLPLFLELVESGRSWNDLGITGHGTTNGNKVLAQTSNVCTSNGAATYLGLVSYVKRPGVPADEADATALAQRIKPLLRGQGLPAAAPADLYFVPEGKETAPVIVIYEHQYLAHQIQHRNQHGRLDAERVLLYPQTALQTQPEFLGLNADGDRLGRLVATDPGLRRRALELGFRVLDNTGVTGSEVLNQFLREREVPVPSTEASDTRASLPDVQLLERMITVIGDCPAQLGNGPVK